MFLNRFLIVLGACFLAASAAWADDIGYVDCSNRSEGVQVFAKPRKTPDVLATVPCGERFTVLVYGFVFSQIQTRDGRVGFVYSNLIAIDRNATSVQQTGSLQVASARTKTPSTPAPAAAPAANPNPPAPAQPQPVAAQPAAAQPVAVKATDPAPSVPQTISADAQPASTSSAPAQAQPAASASLAPVPAAAPESTVPDPAPPAAQPNSPASAQPQPAAAPPASAEPASALPAPVQPASAPAVSAAPAPALASTTTEPAAPATQPDPPAAAQPQPATPEPAPAPIRPAERASWEQPRPALRKPALFEFYGGYAYTRFVPGGGAAASNLNGGMGSVALNLTSWLQIAADSTYNYVNFTGSKNILYGNHFGPRYFYRKPNRFKATPFAEFLIGGSRSDTTITGTGGYTTSVNCISYKAGGGLDLYPTRHWEIRVLDVDYYRTAFGTGLHQNNYWVSTGVVFHLFGGGVR